MPRFGTVTLAVGLLVLGLQPVQARPAAYPREIVTLLPRDAIPAILDPKPLLVPAGSARGIRDDARVLGVALGGDAHAYPIVFLSWHEIVNDVVGGRAIAATW
jgi:hypothetical protein